MTRGALVARWVGAMVAIIVGLVWLHLLGAGDLGAPPASIGGITSWLEQRDAAVAAFALLRLVALGVGWYLLFITAIGGAARALQLRHVTSLVDRLTFPFARGILGGVALLGVVTGPPPAQQPTTDSMVELSADTDHATLHLLPDASGVPDAPAAAPTPTSASVPVPAPSAEANVWVVQHGESFWSIASEHLADITGGPVSEHEVRSYWREVVDMNRSRLANPNDADLIFVGQVIELPAVASG